MLFGAGEKNKNNLKKKIPKKKVKSVQIHMKDPESAEQEKKSNFIFFRFLFFGLWSFRDQIVLVPHCPGTELSGSELALYRIVRDRIVRDQNIRDRIVLAPFK